MGLPAGALTANPPNPPEAQSTPEVLLAPTTRAPVRRRWRLPPSILTLVLFIGVHPELRGVDPISTPSIYQTASGQRRLRLVRSEAGTKGFEQGGRYIIEDPRNAFHFPDDQQIIVSFEWEGPAGPHHFEGRWKNPEGKAVMISDFTFDAQGTRFGGRWTLKLNEFVVPGLWALEAHVDGQVAGMHAFQILSEPDPELAASARRRLAPAEIYNSAVAATVIVQKLGAEGQQLGTGAGFFVSPDTVLTAFQVIDGASSLRITAADRQRTEVRDVVAWDRRRDWVLLKVEFRESSSLPLAEAHSAAVGDRCFSLNAPMVGNWILEEGNIIGKQDFLEVGERLNLSVPLDPKAVGSPVLDGYGSVIGMAVRDDFLPGLASLNRLGFAFSPPNLPFRSRGTIAVPISMLRLPDTDLPTTPLSQLAATHQFVEPLAAYEHLVGGTVARRVEKRKGKPPEVIGEGFEFSRRDPRIVMLVRWNPLEKLKFRSALRVYTLDNELALETEATKHKLKAYTMAYTWWTIHISNLRPGVYRADVLIENEPVFRSFFKVVD